jgi:2-phospho-L-lactate guanylyltransferase
MQKPKAQPLGSCSRRGFDTEPRLVLVSPAYVWLGAPEHSMPHRRGCAEDARRVVTDRLAGSSSMTPPAPDPAHLAVLVPVKRTALAKSRLGGLGDRLRQELAAAFATDTVTALLACEVVARVLVVTDDHLLAGTLRGIGAEVIPDGTTDLNGTLVQAAVEMHRRAPFLWLAAVCADLPALRPQELAAASASAHRSRMSFVSDQDAVGTTAVFAPGLEEFRPSFGSGSRAQHLQAGAFEIDADGVPGLRRDVDDPAALSEALRLGVGARTAQLVRRSQATVSAFDAVTRTGRVLFDDGSVAQFPASALRGSGLLLLRPGQRVRVETVEDQGAVRLVGVQILTLP